MNRIQKLAALMKEFPAWQQVTPEDFLQLMALEWGDPKIFENGIAKNGICIKPVIPSSAGVICAGNLAVSTWQILTRLTLAGVPNLVLKLPSSKEAYLIVQFAKRLLSEKLIDSLELHHEWDAAIFGATDILIVLGNDETIQHFRAQTPWSKPFIGYGHKLSFGVIFEKDFSQKLIENSFTDIVTYNQQGCLSPHAFFVVGNAEQFANELANYFFKNQNRLVPCFDIGHQAQVYAARSTSLFQDEKIWSSENSCDWTVILKKRTEFQSSCLNHLIYIIPIESLEAIAFTMKPHRSHLATVGMSTVQPFNCGATRFCPIGQMQFPSLFWRQDGFPSLACFVKWQTIETS